MKIDDKLQMAYPQKMVEAIILGLVDPPTKSPEEVVTWLKEFRAKLAQRLHDGEAMLDMVSE
jgi:hypothetical protein